MAVLDLQIISGDDDACEYGDGTFYADELFCLSISYTNPNLSAYRCPGFRFQGVTIPPGSVINSAYITLLTYSSGADDPNLKIYGNDVDNANDFVTEADIIGRVRTSAFVSWVATNIGIGWKDSPSITSIIHEIIDRVGWVSGNSLTILFIGNTDISSRQLGCRAYEYSTHIYGAKLHIDYTITILPPDIPSNVLPIDGDEKWNTEVTLESSPFSGGGTHLASQWQISAIAGDYSSPILDSGEDTVNLESISAYGSLSYGVTYYWHVSHKNEGGWSGYSVETSFSLITACDTPEEAIRKILSVTPAVSGDHIEESLVEILTP